MATKTDAKKAAPKKAEKKPAAKKAAPKAEKKPAEKKTTVKKTTKAAEAVQEAAQPIEMKKGSYLTAIGRRKEAIARVRLIKNGRGAITVNGRTADAYFTTYELREIVRSPLKAVGQDDAVDISAKVEGGGLRGQAEAVRLGTSRALIQLNPTFRKALKKLGYLSRDARVKERKKFGLRGARRAKQWSKR
jgi:small subunit ribosomal protein S9